MVVGGRELIDTLWNVNDRRERRNKDSGHRINRYIMECKYDGEICVCKGRDFELIDTLWNVNA